MDSFTRAPMAVEPDLTYRRHHKPEELLAAYRDACCRAKRMLPPSPEEFSGIVRHKIVSVASKIVFVLRRLRRVGTQRYTGLFENSGRSDRIATFLAVLELIKGKRIRVEGKDEMTVKLMDGEKFGD